MKTFDKTESINIEDIEIEKDKILNNKDDIEESLEEVSEDAPIEDSAEETEVVDEAKDEKESDTASLDEIVNNDFQEKTIVSNAIDLKNIGIASDHRGFRKKQKLTKYLIKKGYNVIDYGGAGTKGDDYTEFGFKLGRAILNHEIEKGIAICGSGIGISIACNKIKSIRCAKVNNTKEVKWARRDNDANVIAISAKMPTYRAKDIVDMFLKTNFSGKERHQRRIDQLNNYKDK